MEDRVTPESFSTLERVCDPVSVFKRGVLPMNNQTIAGLFLVFVSLFLPAPWCLVPWFAGVALVGYGRGVAAGERDMRRIWRGGDR